MHAIIARLRLAAACGLPLLSACAAHAPPSASLRAVADSVAEAYASSERWHGGLLVASGESVIYRGAVGSADRTTGALNTPEMRYDIYSISKPFTAIVVLQLVESGDLSLDGTLAEYLPDYPGPATDRITIHHLLSHTSGVPDYITAMLPEYFDAPPNLARDSLLALIARLPLEFEPGEGFGYSNTGYVLLGRIVESVTGQRFEETLEDRIFRPLGMSQTHWSAYPAAAQGVAVAYREDRVAPIERIQPGEAGIVSTLDDMHRFAMAIGSTDLLSRESWSLAFTPYGDPSRALRSHPAHGTPYGYGFGLSTLELDDGTTVRIAEHGGAGGGGSAMLQREIDGDGIVLLWNNTARPDPYIPELTELAVRADGR